MRICFCSNHYYPGKLYGIAPPIIHDYLVKGLAELGHDVYYVLAEKPDRPLPEGVRFAKSICYNADCLHWNVGRTDGMAERSGLPWLRIIHSDIRMLGLDLSIARPNWIYVSRALAGIYKSDRVVHNGVDPKDFIYAETKDNYLLFLIGGRVERAEGKGFSIALEAAQKTGVPLLVACAEPDPAKRAAFEAFCAKKGAIPIGLINGRRKAELMAHARAVIVPSQFQDPLPTVIIEALMSGTPVIASSAGGIPEMLDQKTGFICNSMPEYIRAVERSHLIKPSDCRKRALEKFHYLDMAKDYIREYSREIAYS